MSKTICGMDFFEVIANLEGIGSFQDCRFRNALFINWRGSGEYHNCEVSVVPADLEECDPRDLTGAVLDLSRRVLAGDWGCLPELADALQDAGCTSESMINACQSGIMLPLALAEAVDTQFSGFTYWRPFGFWDMASARASISGPGLNGNAIKLSLRR